MKWRFGSFGLLINSQVVARVPKRMYKFGSWLYLYKERVLAKRMGVNKLLELTPKEMKAIRI